MSTSVTPVASAPAKESEQKKQGEKITVTVMGGEAAIIVHEAVKKITDKVFELQDDVENPSKFLRAFIFDAVLAYAKVTCAKAENDWERAVWKYNKKHRTLSPEQAASELLIAKKMQSLKEYADRAAILKKQFAE